MTKQEKYRILVSRAEAQLHKCKADIKKAKAGPYVSKQDILLLEGMHRVLQEKILMYRRRMEGDSNACEQSL